MKEKQQEQERLILLAALAEAVLAEVFHLLAEKAVLSDETYLECRSAVARAGDCLRAVRATAPWALEEKPA